MIFPTMTNNGKVITPGERESYEMPLEDGFEHLLPLEGETIFTGRSAWGPRFALHHLPALKKTSKKQAQAQSLQAEPSPGVWVSEEYVLLGRASTETASVSSRQNETGCRSCVGDCFWSFKPFSTRNWQHSREERFFTCATDPCGSSLPRDEG